MHIPDGYLSPETCATFGAAMVPVWSVSARRVRHVVKNRHVPLLAMGAAYCFLTMMFNVPIPDGTTAHAVGGVLVAVLLGPEAAIIAVSIALAIQALFFGDGGVLAYGANAFNMAVVMPLAGYAVYRLLSRGRTLTSPRRAVAAGVGGYVGLNAAALLAAVEFGLQPVLFHRADGTPLYAPFHLAQSIPAMMLAHLTVAGMVELALTAGVVAYLQRANLPLLRINHPDIPTGNPEPAGGDDAEAPAGSRWRWAIIPLGLMAVLTPLGLLAPGTAFGESTPGGLNLAKYHLAGVPDGLRRYAGFWHHALFRGYDFRHDAHPAVGYLVSAVAGMAAVAAAIGAAVLIARLARAVAARRQRRPAIVIPQPAPVTRPTANSSALPQWLAANEVGLCPCGCIGRRRKGSFVDKTIAGAAGVMSQALFSEDVASGSGLLQRLEVRVKLITLLLLLVVAALVRHLPVLLALYALTLAVAAASGISLRFFVKRVWLFIPIFTGIVVLPATLNLITHGRIVVPLGYWWFGHRVGLTAQGLDAAGLIVARVAVSISMVVLLTLTTPWNRLMAGLRALAVPKIFILVLGMAYRYIFHLLGAVTDMYAARKARVAGGDADVVAGRAFVSATAGALFGKSHALSEEVHMAMLSRGYTGEVRTLVAVRPAWPDWTWAALSLAVAVLVFGGDRVLGR